MHARMPAAFHVVPLGAAISRPRVLYLLENTRCILPPLRRCLPPCPVSIERWRWQWRRWLSFVCIDAPT